MINYKERKQALEQLFQQLSSRLRQLDDEKNKATTEMVQIQGKLIMLKELETETKETKANEDKTTPPQPENDKAEEAAKEAEVKTDEKTKEEPKPEQEKKDK